MPDFSQSVEMSFILKTIGAIFALVGVGIFLVKANKNKHNP